ncbi:Ger(x)C family spore germination protein [Priestia abyssalis]|uniref:Ger(x)C family spore germination protein n=1 Tax=Priestia abyssalis TaxID=1221450 RepID=UPI000995B650|nr:Ger(x)C family spore germination protein [Priestia abyssalis]
MKQKAKNAEIFFVLLLGLLLLSMTGCWSSKEIEEVGLAAGLALDKGEESTIEKELKEQGGGYPKRDIITVTYQFVNPQAEDKESSSGGAQQKSYTNVSETGDSVHQITREVSLRREGPLFSPHLKVIVIGEDLARTYSLEPLLNQFIRDNEIRPSCLVFISKGQARKVMESKEPGEVPSFRLVGIVDNEYRTTRILPSVSLAKLEGKMQSGSSFLLQNIISANGEVKFAGAAVIKGKTKKLNGFLDEAELDGITWITGKGKGGLVKSFDEKTGQLVVYEIKSMKSRIIPHVHGNKISFDVDIESEGRLSENWAVSEAAFENEFLKRVEKAAEQEVKGLVKNVTEKMQKEYEADVAGFGNRLRIEHPKVWEKVKKDWDETFSEVPIKYNVKLTIKDYGTSGSNQ